MLFAVERSESEAIAADYATLDAKTKPFFRVDKSYLV